MSVINLSPSPILNVLLLLQKHVNIKYKRDCIVIGLFWSHCRQLCIVIIQALDKMSSLNQIVLLIYGVEKLSHGL